MAPLGASLARGGRGRALRTLHQPALADRLLHVLRLLPVPAAVLELDRGIEPLAGVLLDLVALAAPQRADHALVLDSHLLERLLDLPAGVASDLEPDARAAMELDGHAASFGWTRDANLRYARAGDRPRCVRAAAARGPARARAVARGARLRALRLRRREDRPRARGHGARTRGRRTDARGPRGVDPPQALRGVRALPRRARVDVRALLGADDRARRLRRARSSAPRSARTSTRARRGSARTPRRACGGSTPRGPRASVRRPRVRAPCPRARDRSSRRRSRRARRRAPRATARARAGPRAAAARTHLGRSPARAYRRFASRVQPKEAAWPSSSIAARASGSRSEATPAGRSRRRSRRWESSTSAFSIFQQGWPPTLNQTHEQRWSLTAMRPPSVGHATQTYDTPVRAIVLDASGQPQLADLPAPSRRSRCSRAGSAAPTSRRSAARPRARCSDTRSSCARRWAG